MSVSLRGREFEAVHMCLQSELLVVWVYVSLRVSPSESSPASVTLHKAHFILHSMIHVYKVIAFCFC